MFSTKVCLFIFIVCILQKHLVKSEYDDITEDKVEKLVRGYGYPIEKHLVQTDDNYVLCVHRIPYGKKTTTKRNRVVLVQHGLLSSSADSVFTGPDKALSLILADQGYDVWIGNARGNTFSKQNTLLDPVKNKTKFWDFSFHEIGTIDVPAMIDYILEKTGQEQLFYVGHSQGTTTFFVMASEKPEYNDKILAQFSLAPSVYMGNIKNPFLHMISNFNSFLSYESYTGVGEFEPANEKMQIAIKIFCARRKELCANLFSLAGGFNPDQSEEDLSMITSNLIDIFPAGASIGQIKHFSQELKSGQFRQLDYGFLNYLKYNSFQPPKYNLKNVKAPVHLFYSKHDWLGSSEDDVWRLCKEIQNCQNATLVADGNYNHFDFLMGVHVKTYVYDSIIEIMNGKGIGPPSHEATTKSTGGAEDLKIFTFSSFLVLCVFIVL